MFRVFDTEKEIWLKNDIYLTSDGRLFKIKQSLFGMIKVPLELSSERYVYHKSVNLIDKDGYEIFEGDYIEAKVSNDKTVIGLVCYAEELSAYVILCADSNEFFTLGSEVCDYIKVIGNVFDGYEEGEQNGQQTLQDEKIS